MEINYSTQEGKETPAQVAQNGITIQEIQNVPLKCDSEEIRK